MTKTSLGIALVIVGAAAATLAVLHFKRAQFAVELAVRPGELSQPHAFLDNNCAACHTAGKGVEAQNCIVCHANNDHVLQRQPTAFHAEISSCVACHIEHQGRVARTTKMDHTALARIAFTRLKSDAKASAADVAQAKQLKQWLGEQSGAHFENTQLKPEERLLNCATCHQTKDRHVGLFWDRLRVMSQHVKVDDLRVPPSGRLVAVLRAMPSSAAEPLHDAFQDDRSSGLRAAEREGEPMFSLPSDNQLERHQRGRLVQTPLTSGASS